MREDHEETMQKMFPEGYVLLYTCPNNTIRFNFYNPEGYQELNQIQEHILRIKGLLN